ncbi:hypothetical protein Hanom_Chr02g00102051 [Helianthus anomalus]
MKVLFLTFIFLHGKIVYMEFEISSLSFYIVYISFQHLYSHVCFIFRLGSCSQSRTENLGMRKNLSKQLYSCLEPHCLKYGVSYF